MDFQQLCTLQDKLIGAGSYLYKYPCEGFRSAELAAASHQPIGTLLGNPKQYWVQVSDQKTLFWRKAPTANVSSRRQVSVRDIDAVCQGVRIIARARPIVAGQFRLCFTISLNSRCLIFRAPSIRVLQTWIEAVNRLVFDFGRPPARVLDENLMRTLTLTTAGPCAQQSSTVSPLQRWVVVVWRPALLSTTREWHTCMRAMPLADWYVRFCLLPRLQMNPRGWRK